MASMRRPATILIAFLVLAAPAAAATPAQILAATLKPVMQQQFKSKVKGLVFTKITCTVPKKSKLVAGHCRAAFTVKRYRLTGVYQVIAEINAKGQLGWRTTSVACKDSQTRKTIKC
jgi:uncharacterized lipoprotein YbaY